MPRPRSPGDKVKAGLALMDEGHTAEEAAAKVGGVSERTLYRRRGEVSAPSSPTMARKAEIDRLPATARKKMMDEMMAQSDFIEKVKGALARGLARHPEAAADVARELRAIAL